MIKLDIEKRIVYKHRSSTRLHTGTTVVNATFGVFYSKPVFKTGVPNACKDVGQALSSVVAMG